MKRVFKPLRDCLILASENHHSLKPLEFVGRVISVDGGVAVFKDAKGETDRIIWKNNNTIILGV